MGRYSLGIIGAGGIIASHLDAIKKIPSFKVSGVCDIDPERCKKVAKEARSAAHADYKDLLNEKPDAVLIAVPHWLHCDITVAALEAGCNVLLEKPMANSVKECQKMLSTANKCSKKLLVAEMDAFAPGALYTGAHFKKGNLGQFFTSICCNHRYYFAPERPQWFLDTKKSGGGMFSNVGLHRLAVTRSCLPAKKPISVCASVSYQKDIRIEACTSAFVRYKDGGVALYEEVGYYPKTSWVNTGSHFVFEEGTVAWDDKNWRMISKDGSVRCEPLEPYRMYEPVYECFLKALHGEDYSPQACEFAEDVAIVRAAYESSTSGREVIISGCEDNMDFNL